jgi:hypothetical protein
VVQFQFDRGGLELEITIVKRLYEKQGDRKLPLSALIRSLSPRGLLSACLTSSMIQYSVSGALTSFLIVFLGGYTLHWLCGHVQNGMTISREKMSCNPGMWNSDWTGRIAKTVRQCPVLPDTRSQLSTTTESIYSSTYSPDFISFRPSLALGVMPFVTFFDARLSRGTSSAGCRVLVSRMGSGVGQNRGSGEFSGRANGSGKGD